MILKVKTSRLQTSGFETLCKKQRNFTFKQDTM